MNYGIHLDLPASDYHAMPGASASQLRTLWQSTPAHLRASLDAPRAATSALKLGTLAHSVVLEPDKPLPGVAIQPDEYEPGKKWTNAAKLCKDWRAEQEAAGLMVLKADEYDAAFAMARNLATHPSAGPLLTDGRPEVSLVVRDETNGIDCRARVDWLPNSHAAIVDLKTTSDASERAFTKKAYDLGYHIQAAFYLDLWNALMPSEPRSAFFFVVVENTSPFAVNVFECSPEFVALGRQHYQQALALFARCSNENYWPAYAPTVHQLNLPRYADK